MILACSSWAQVANNHIYWGIGFTMVQQDWENYYTYLEEAVEKGFIFSALDEPVLL